MRFYLDANVFIAAVEGDDRLREAIWLCIEAGRSNPGALVTSEMTLAELLVKPLELKQEDLVSTYNDLLGGEAGVTVRPVDRGILIRAAQYRAQRRTIKLPDAIHLATAGEAGCTAIVSADRRLGAAVPVGLHFIELSRESATRLSEELQ